MEVDLANQEPRLDPLWKRWQQWRRREEKVEIWAFSIYVAGFVFLFIWTLFWGLK